MAGAKERRGCLEVEEGADIDESPGEYVQRVLDRQVGGGGRFQRLYLLALGLPWAYGAILVYNGSFAGSEAFAEGVNCTLPVAERVLERLELNETLSFIADFDLVCENHHLVPMLSTLYFFGFSFGVPFFGALSDAKGRRLGYAVPLAIILLAMVLAAAAPGYKTLAAAKILAGFGNGGFGLVAYVWSAEVLGTDFRQVLSLSPNVLWALGQLLLSPLAYFLRGWRALSWAVAALGVVNVLYFPWLLESPQWLASRGRTEEAWAVLAAAARCNGRPPPARPGGFGAPKLQVPAARGGGARCAAAGLLDRRLVRRFLVMCFSWFATSLAFFGLSLNAATLPLDVYTANAVSALSCVPGYFLAVYLVDAPWCGRRGTTALGFLLAGACLLLSTFGGKLQLLVLYYVATSAAAMVFAVIYVWASELFPTDVRGVSMGLQSLSARLGAMAAPFIADLGRGNQSLPLIVFAVPCIVAGLLDLGLPETRGRRLPSTVDDLGGSGDESGSSSSGSDCSE